MPRRVRPSWRHRFARFVRALFRSGGAQDLPPDDLEGGLGVREPRRPVRPSSSGAVALEIPADERRDVRAIGEARD